MSPKLSEQAISILNERYFDKDEDGNVIEDWRGLSKRVSRAIAAADHGTEANPGYWESRFFEAIYGLDFLPNSPTLFNAGSRSRLGLLSACFVQVPDDSIDSIMQHAWWSAKLFQAGAGVGYNFSRLREEGALVGSSMRPSSGAVSFMHHIFNSIGEVIRQGGRRRAAMMGLLDDDHPDIERFITFKNNEKTLVNFNISVFASDDFMRAIVNNKEWNLRGRTSGDVVKTVSARHLFEMMIDNNWKMAEPGMIWRDNINKHNPILMSGYEIECVNPCGEATLLNLENCCLGTINLTNHIVGNSIDYEHLRRTVWTAVRFLDNVITANRHVHDGFAQASYATRRIGIGVTGFADVLVMLDSVYGSPSSYTIAEEIASFIVEEAVKASSSLARERGPYPLWDKSYHKHVLDLPLRNVSLMAIAPEGSRSIICGTSPSIEPNFGRIIVRTKKGIGAGVQRHPLADRPAFVTTYEVPFEAHIKMQSVWQNAINKYMIGQAISKTNNAPSDISLDELAEAYIYAWESGCKGLTVYRDTSRDAVYYEHRDDELRDEHGRLIQECVTGACDIGFDKTPVKA